MMRFLKLQTLFAFGISVISCGQASESNLKETPQGVIDISESISKFLGEYEYKDSEGRSSMVTIERSQFSVISPNAEIATSDGMHRLVKENSASIKSGVSWSKGTEPLQLEWPKVLGEDLFPLYITDKQGTIGDYILLQGSNLFVTGKWINANHLQFSYANSIVQAVPPTVDFKLDGENLIITVTKQEKFGADKDSKEYKLMRTKK